MGVLDERGRSSLKVKDAIKDLVNCYRKRDIPLEELYEFLESFIVESNLQNTLVEQIIVISFLEYKKEKGERNVNSSI